MLRVPFLVATALAIAFSGGVASVKWAIDADDPFESLYVGPWQATPLAQTEAANPYAKARRALEGTLALGQAEGLVFRAGTDSAGAPLTGNCAYRVTGRTPASRLWTLRITDSRGATLPVPEEFPRSAYSGDLLYGPDNTVTIVLDREARSGNWVKLAHGGRFEVELTLFDTPAAGNFGLIEFPMPEIERGDCDNA